MIKFRAVIETGGWGKIIGWDLQYPSTHATEPSLSQTGSKYKKEIWLKRWGGVSRGRGRDISGRQTITLVFFRKANASSPNLPGSEDIHSLLWISHVGASPPSWSLLPSPFQKWGHGIKAAAAAICWWLREKAKLIPNSLVLTSLSH